MTFAEVLFLSCASATESLASDPTLDFLLGKKTLETVNVLLVPPPQQAHVDETLGSFTNMSTGISFNSV